VPENQRDWRGWEQLRLRVLARSSAGALPFRPLGVTIRSGFERISWEDEVSALPAGRAEFSFDLRRTTQLERRSLHWNPSPRTNARTDQLEFASRQLELIRYSADAG
jgi:hypothetical protein